MVWAERTGELLDHLRAAGLVAIVKADGERDKSPWTVLITGPLLGDDYVRAETSSLEAALSHSVAELRRRVPALVLPVE